MKRWSPRLVFDGDDFRVGFDEEARARHRPVRVAAVEDGPRDVMQRSPPHLCASRMWMRRL